jgi:hypothetical protein
MGRGEVMSIEAISPDGESRAYLRKISESVMTGVMGDLCPEALQFQSWIRGMLKEEVEAFKRLDILQLNQNDVYALAMDDLKNWVDGVDEKPQSPEVGEGSMYLLIQDDSTRHIIGRDNIKEFTPAHGRGSTPLITCKSPTYFKKNLYSIKEGDIRDMVVMVTKDLSFAINKHINRLFDNIAAAIASFSKIYKWDDKPVKIGNNLVYPGFVKIYASEPQFEQELKFGELQTQLRMYMAIDTLDVRKIAKV